MDFGKVRDCLPSLLEGMHMIWILSRYYCTDATMVPLLERIAWCLCEKVKTAMNNTTIFRKPLEEVDKDTTEAREMMKVWKDTYMEIREKIELSGKAARWEFDKKKLFGECDYLASVCKDLNAVVNVIFDFTNIFGDELKSILNDPQKIDAVIRRVEKLVVPIENADFDIFKETCKENWEAIMNFFFKEVKQLEKEASYFIDQCFKMLRYDFNF